MTIYCLLFESKSIQEYLFSSGRLRDVIGASELVDSLTGQLLDDTLQSLGYQIGNDIEFSRRAGGAFYAFSEYENNIDQLKMLWTLTVQQYAPGMAYDLGDGSGENHLTAFDEAKRAIRRDASRYRPMLPIASPLTERSRRTGLAAVSFDDKDGMLDAATKRKKHMANPSLAEFIGRFSPGEADLHWRNWPRNLEPGEDDAFPFHGDDRTIALVHADGNGLGQLLMKAHKAAEQHPDRFVSVFKNLSEIIGECTQQAAQQATREVLIEARKNNGPLPARPILMGGDDLTIIVRADLALPFLRTFVREFEARSRGAMDRLCEYSMEALPERLTIGAGMVYLGANQPFYLAGKLVESLTEHAKMSARKINAEQPPSSLAFHRVTVTLVEEYDAIVAGAFTQMEHQMAYTQTLGAYYFQAGAATPRLDDLLELQQLIQADDMARGPTRQLLTLMGLSPSQARTRYRRWRQLMREHKQERLEKFDAILQRLLDGYSIDSDLPYANTGDRHISPLGDALALMAVGNIAPHKAIGKEGKA